MSIYCTRLVVGDDGLLDSSDVPGGARVYMQSHVYPSTEHEPAYLSTANIPHWCIPGHDDDCADGYGGPYAPWLRLTMGTPEIGNDHDVVLAREAGEALRDDLNAWLEHTSRRCLREAS